MAQNYEIDIKRFNGQDYDTLLPTPASHASTHQAGGSDPITVKTGNIEDSAVTNAKITNGAVSTGKIAAGAVTRTKLASDVKVLAFTNKAVATSAWASNSTYTDFPYRAAVACEGVTVNHYAAVVFSPTDALDGTFCPVVESYDGGVYLYANEVPSAVVTIPTIVCTPVE